MTFKAVVVESSFREAAIREAAIRYASKIMFSIDCLFAWSVTRSVKLCRL